MRSPSRRFALTVACGLAAAGLAAASTRALVVDQEDLARYWTPVAGLPRVVPGFPAGGDHGKDACVTIGFQVSAEGTTLGFSELLSWTSTSTSGVERPSTAEVQAYVQSAAAAVSMWHFTPYGRARPVYSSASFAFPGTAGADQAPVLAHCRIHDLEGFIAKQQDADQRRGNILKSRMESRARAESLRGVWEPGR